MEQEISKKIIVYGAILGLIALSLVVVWPVILSVITGLILAYICYPVYLIIFKIVREKNISALIVLLLLLFIIFLPFWFLFPLIARQAIGAYGYIQTVDIIGTLKNLFPSAMSNEIIGMANTFISNSINFVFSKLSDVLINITNILLQATVVLIVFFFGMRDAEILKEYAKGISPFSKELEKSLTDQFKGITQSVIFGHIVVGILQGLLTGLGLFIAGVPNAIFLTILAIFSAVLPIIGAWLVWIPVVIYLFISGHTNSAIFLMLYCGIIVSWIDNILRPYIVARSSNVSSGVVLVGMIGGLIVFGVIGLVLGPLILSYLIVLIDAYKNKKLSEFFSK